MKIEPRWNRQDQLYIYAVLCRDDDGPLYVKFGRTSNLYRRLREVSQGTPIPARYFAFFNVERRHFRALEKLLLLKFEHRKVRGEWFKFDANSQEDRAEFNQLSRAAFSECTGKPDSWSKVSVEAIDRYATERKNAYLRSNKRLEVSSQGDTVRSSWEELRKYGYH